MFRYLGDLKSQVAYSSLFCVIKYFPSFLLTRPGHRVLLSVLVDVVEVLIQCSILVVEWLSIFVVFIRVHALRCICTHAHTHTSTHPRKHACTHACTHARMHMCTLKVEIAD